MPAETEGLMKLAELDVPFEFVERPITLAADMRPLWRIGVLILIVDKCWGQTATLEQLHVLNWAIRGKNSRALFLQIMNEGTPPDAAIVRFDPSLPRAIAFAVAEKLCIRSSDRLSLTEKGMTFLAKLMADNSVLEEEKKYLQGIRGKLSDKRVAGLLYPRTQR